MVDRIDFALEPGVILVAVFFFVLANVLLAAVLYPYFRGASESSTGEDEAPEAVPPMVDASTREPLEERVDEFLEDIHEGRES